MMPSATFGKMSWLILLTLSSRVVAQVPPTYPYLATRQDSPVLAFAGIQQLKFTSCAPIFFTWIYAGPDSPVSIYITNIGDIQDATTSTRQPLPTFSDSSSHNARSLYRRDDISIQLVSSVSPTGDGLHLTALPVPQGRYHLVAVINSISPPYTAHSSSFTVQGDNTSCLSSSLASSSFSLTSSTSTLSSSATSSGLASITSSDVSSASTSPIVPVGGASATQVNKSAIAGGVTAGAVVLIAAAVLYFCVTHPKRSRAHSRAPSASHSHASGKGGLGIGAPGGGDGGGRWGGLPSVDSHVPLGNSVTQRPYVNTERQVNGAGASQDDINSYHSRSGSLKDGGYAGSPFEEKFAGSPSEEMTLSTLPYRGPDLYAPNDNARSYSMASTNLSDNRYSQSHAWRTSLESSSTHTHSPFHNPPVSSPAALARITVAVPNPPRKAARKPVPAYDESSAFPTPSPVSSYPAHATTPFADPVLPYHAPVSSGHYSTRAERESLKSSSSKKTRSKSKMRDNDKDKSNPSSATASSEELSSQELVHKNSFGPAGVEGKQLHYLIPDMPIGSR